jgi:hypothetical protein
LSLINGGKVEEKKGKRGKGNKKMKQKKMARGLGREKIVLCKDIGLY